MIEPQFLKELADDAASIAHVRRVDQQLVFEVMLLMLTHFAGNLIVDHRGNPMRVARNTMLVSRRRSCPLWLKPIMAGIHARKKDQDDNGFADGLISSGLVQQPEDDDDDAVQEMLRRANPAPFPLPASLEHGLPGFSPPIGRYLVTHDDGPCLVQGLAEDGAVVLVEGSRHLRALCDAQEQYNALWGHLERSRPRVSVFGWCERGESGIQDLRFPGNPLLLAAPYGGGMRMNTLLEDHGVVHHRNIFFDEGRNLQAFAMLLNHLLAMRESHQVMTFEPNERCRELLKHAADDEHRDVQEFPMEYRRLAKPVMGLSQSLAAMFWLLEHRPQRPMETLMLTSVALSIARQIRRRSLGWLRRELATGCPQINAMEMQVLVKLRDEGYALTRRQIRRMFHRLRSPELNEVLSRLQACDQVRDQAGKVVAV